MVVCFGRRTCRSDLRLISPGGNCRPSLARFHVVTRKTLKWISPILVLAFLTTAARWFPVAEILREMLSWTQSPGYVGVIVYALAYALTAMLCVPCRPLTIGAGVLFGPALGIISVVGGSGMAAAAGFLMARHTHRDRIMQSVGKKQFIPRCVFPSCGHSRMDLLGCYFPNPESSKAARHSGWIISEVFRDSRR